MSEVARVFVSHSSLDNDYVRQLCQALRSEASERTYEPVVDFEQLPDYDLLVDIEGLEAGRPWPKQLHEWMARCHSAVLLLTRNAVASPWVLKEATILSWRLSLEPSFRLITLRESEVTDELLSGAGFDPLMLQNIQQCPLGDAHQMATHIRQAMGGPGLRPTPHDSLCAALEDLASDVKPNALKRLAEGLHIQPPHWLPDVDERTQYVQAIARQLLSEELGDFADLAELVDVLLNGAPTETVQKILYLVAPQWVDAQAAGRLPGIATSQPRRSVAMNGELVGAFTAEMYVRRAHPLSRRQEVLTIAGGNSGDLVTHVTRELYAHMQQEAFSDDSGDALTEDQLAEVTRHYGRGKPRRYVVLPPPHREADVRALMDRFPKLTFILWQGAELPPSVSELVVNLEPPVDLDQEEQQRESYEEARQMLTGL